MESDEAIKKIKNECEKQINLCFECKTDFLKLKEQYESTRNENTKLKQEIEQLKKIPGSSCEKKSRTNFDILSSSPERLAQYLYKITECQYNYNALLDYLNKKRS